MPGEPGELVYRSRYTAEELQAKIDDMLASDSESFSAELEAACIEPSELGPGFISVRESGSAFDPATVTLIIAFAAPAVRDIWKLVILPRLVRRWGIDTLEGEEEGNGS